jgi:hypothetical protein
MLSTSPQHLHPLIFHYLYPLFSPALFGFIYTPQTRIASPSSSTYPFAAFSLIYLAVYAFSMLLAAEPNNQ